MADSVNQKLGRDVIVLTGARTDINKLIAPCKLFVGVSRAALEAMAADKPVIIAGNEDISDCLTKANLRLALILTSVAAVVKCRTVSL